MPRNFTTLSSLSDEFGGVVIMDSTHYNNKLMELFEVKIIYEQITQTITKNIVVFNKSYKKINQKRKQILIFINW